MATEKKITIQYQTLHRLLGALTLLSLCICVVAAGLAGSRLMTIFWRCFLLCLAFRVLNYFIIRAWSSWEEVSARR